MRCSILSLNFLALAVSAYPYPPALIDQHEYRAPSANDSRSPCPMMNTLANHGYVARNGRNISLADMQAGFEAAINLEPSFSIGPFGVAVTASTTGRNDTFNLHDLLKHNLIEHDLSLSRKDAFLGDALNFDEEVWAGTSAVWRNTNATTVSIEAAAKGRLARMAIDKVENPAYNLTAAGEAAGLGETGLFLVVMGDKVEGNARVDWVDIFFRESRLPFAEGWTRSTEVITSEHVANMKAKIVEFSS
ncbi:hypothetical protein KVR01_005548 [Diaporthe batatas]|uniref:uncharacterized protein n=1 Tax=Diaporthe batatas TaxID=748121 RepID=UPI001D044862|nr:uncharacterized protein KVR01_005548 [Diaporthe batatas]KAG8165273.1 hypothetical protein KVR01_005548 [Diaporthe batatas]